MSDSALELHHTGDLLRVRKLARARREMRRQSERWLALVRLVGACDFFAVAATLGYGAGLLEWRVLLPILSAYAAIAGLILVVTRDEGPLRPLSVFAPSIDVLVVYALQDLGMPLSPQPAGVAGWTLGVLVLLVLLASLTLRPAMIAATAVFAWVCEAMLQQKAGINWGTILASGIVLGLAAVVTALAARRIEELVSRMAAEEVAGRLQQERNLELELAAAEVRAAHRELAVQHAELVAAHQRAERLSQLVVHDLKGPLTSVLTLMELTASHLEGDAPARADLGVALREGQRMLGMVQDLLAISRLEEGALRIEPRQQRVLPILEAIAAAHGPAAQQKGAPLTVRAHPELTFVFDPGLLHRLIENLVLNALRFVGKGEGIEVAAGIQDGELQLLVANNGKAISPQRRDSIFEKQVVTPAPGARHNFGLGLTFCRLVAEAHGGRIALEDVPGWEVAFVVRLPSGIAPVGRLV